MAKGVTVIISCFNSAERLPVTLEHLAAQRVSDEIPWEIIVVDNLSSDGTAYVASEVWSKQAKTNIRFQITEAKEPGLSNARKQGIASAQYDFVIFCDDDNWLDAQYIQTAYELLEGDATIGAAGGQSTASSTDGFPGWFKEFEGAYAVGKQQSQSGDVSARGYVWGAGMVLRKELFERAYLRAPSLLLDREGMKLSSGGDNELCKRLLLMGYRLHYDERLKFVHFIPSSRLTEAYRDRLLAGFADAYPILHQYAILVDLRALGLLGKARTLIIACGRILLSRLGILKSETAIGASLKIYILTGIRFEPRNAGSQIMRRIYFELH